MRWLSSVGLEIGSFRRTYEVDYVPDHSSAAFLVGASIATGVEGNVGWLVLGANIEADINATGVGQYLNLTVGVAPGRF